MTRHVQNADNLVMERRLRPIYDWLDTGCNKKALAECDKVLKKVPTLQCVKALKALTLYRMGRDTDATSLLESLIIEIPGDDATLQAMTLCYREMCQLEKICQIYEAALKTDPKNEELHTHLFMSYVRVNDYKAQQRVAMALSKQIPKNPYFCWAVMSIVLQASRGEGAMDPEKKTLLLSLGERMMKKFIDDGKVDAEQEVNLYILILEHQERYMDIINLLDTPLGELLHCENPSLTKLFYLKKLGHWSEVNVLSKAILQDNIDRWDVWKDYIHSSFELFTECVLNGDSSPSSLEDIDNTPEKVHEFICTLMESVPVNSYLLRGPYLARFELCCKLKERAINYLELLGHPRLLFAEYFQKFGHKLSVTSDLKGFLHLLENNHQRGEMSRRLFKADVLGFEYNEFADNFQEDNINRHVTALQIARLCGRLRFPLNVERALTIAENYRKWHTFGLTYLFELAGPFDIHPSDNYALLSTPLLFDFANFENNGDYLLVAMEFINAVLVHSPSNFHVKLLAVKLLHLLGDITSANSMYYSLDVKHLQLDSLGYMHCGRLATTGLFTMCAIHFDAALKFFTSQYKDSTDHMTYSYKYGSFMKLEEFMDFRERIIHSMHYYNCVVDRIVLNLIDCNKFENFLQINISPKEYQIDWEKMRDNRDVEVMVNFEPQFVDVDVKDSEQMKRLSLQDKMFLKLRTHILTAVFEAAELLTNPEEGAEWTKTHADNIKSILEDWKSLEQETLEICGDPVPENCLFLPFPSRVHAHCEAPYRSCLSKLLELFISLSLDEYEDSVLNCKNAINEIESIMTRLKGQVNFETQDYKEKRKAMEIIINYLEVICISCVIVILMNETIRPAPTSKKGKKKPTTDSKYRDIVSRLADALTVEIGEFRELMITFQKAAVVIQPIPRFWTKLDDRRTQESYVRKINESYRIAYLDIQEVLKNKLKMLADL